MKLSNKVALVTGAARGIGFTLAARLCAEGAQVALADLDAASVTEAAEAIRRDQPDARCLPVTVDVADRACVEAMVAQVVATLGQVDVLVSNAGIWKQLTSGPFWQIPSSEWQRAFSVNTEGAFNCAAAIAPHMIGRKGGRIIFIGSAAIGEALAHVTHYTASKAALIGLMRCAAKQLGPEGITVNMVNPGQIDTGAFSREQLESKAQGKFMRRVGVPQDLEGIVAFLAGDDSGYITAQQIQVDGGGVLN